MDRKQKRHKKSLRFLTVFMAVVLVAGLTACGSSQDGGSSATVATPPAQVEGDTEPAATGEPQYGGTLRIAWGIAADTKQQIGAPWRIARGTYSCAVPILETLLLESNDGNHEPWLCESYSVDAEKGELTFTIREGIKFHDGSDLTNEVVAWNIGKWIEDAVLDPKVIGVEARGDRDTVVLFSQYTNAFLTTVSSHRHGIISQAAYEQYGDPEIENHPVGTGPFVFDSVIPGQLSRSVRNENYWQEGKPYLDAIEFVEITDRNTQNAAMMAATGDQAVDVLEASSAQQAAEFVDVEGVSVLTEDGLTISLFPDSENPDSPLSNVEVREAISYAIDRQALCDAFGYGFHKPMYQYVPESRKAYLPEDDPAVLKPYDPEKAKQMLADAGYADGFSTVLTTSVQEPGFDKETLEAIAGMLREVGIDATTEILQVAEKNSKEMNGWEGFIVSAINPFPNDMYTYVRHGLEPNYQSYPSTWRDAEGSRVAYDTAGLTADTEPELVQEVHRIYLADRTLIPMFNVEAATIIKNYVHDTQFDFYHAGTLFRPDNAWLEAR